MSLIEQVRNNLGFDQVRIFLNYLKILNFKESVTNKYNSNDIRLLKSTSWWIKAFLAVNDDNPRDAAAMLAGALTWRETFSVHRM